MEFETTFRSYLGRCTVNFTNTNDPKYYQKYTQKDEQKIMLMYLKGKSSCG